MDAPDDLDDYLRGGSALSRQYRREASPPPPHALDRRVLKAALDDLRPAQKRSPWLAPLAFAASVLLSVALVLAIAFGPQTPKRTEDGPRLVRTAVRADDSPKLYSTDPLRARAPSAWLADIAALQQAGRHREAETELRRFRSVYPDYPARALDIEP